jgi:hypothetical protein
VELARILDHALSRMARSGRLDVRENGIGLPALENFRYEVHPNGPHALLHLWSDDRNLIRQVLRVVSEKPERLALEVARIGRRRPVRLDFLAAARKSSAARVTRERFRWRFRELLMQQFPDESIISLTAAPDLEHSLSGNYVRGIVKDASRAWAVIAAAPDEAASTYDGLLAFGLLWLHRARESRPGAPVRGLRLFFPQGSGRVTAHRLAALSDGDAIELHEYAPASWKARKLDGRDVGNLQTWIASRRDAESAMQAASSFIESVRRIVPNAIHADAIPGTNHVAVRFHGLLFARWQPEGIFFGVGDPKTMLCPSRQSEFDRLISRLSTHRSPLSDDTSHPYFRAQPERWLEALAASDLSHLDAQLNPRYAYSQVPALHVGDRRVMDLVAITRDTRLVVIELKAQEDLHMVLQAVDYWLRVRWHHSERHFSRYGYFPGIELDPRPPRLLLVAPALRLHPATDILLRYVKPEIEITRIGLSEQWRRGLQVVLRQGRR